MVELRKMEGETKQELYIIQSLRTHAANAQGYMRVDEVVKEEDLKKYIETSKVAAAV
jgi:hypothetical protein